MSSPSVGVVGSSLGGGLSWYGRSYGLQCSAVTAVEVVLADGTFVRATDERDSDLLWAARGGGGGFGVVTALEFDLIPVAAPYAGMLVWDWAQARRVLDAWADWAADAPDEATSVLRLFQAPDVPWLPDAGARPHRRRRSTGRSSATRGPPPRSSRRCGRCDPEIDTFAVTPGRVAGPAAPGAGGAARRVRQQHPARPGCRRTPSRRWWRPPARTRASELLFAEVRQLGGALSRPSPRGGALDRIDGEFLVLDARCRRGPGRLGRPARGRRAGAGRRAALGNRRAVPVDDRRPGGRTPGGARPRTGDRLRRVRSAADPDGRFVVPHFRPRRPSHRGAL